MRFVLDDGPWANDTTSAEDISDALEALADRLEAARTRLEDVGVYEGIFDASVAPGVKLYDVLFNEENPLRLDRGLRLRLSIRIERLKTWGDDEVNAFEVEVADQRLTAPSVDKARERCVSGAQTACITPATSGRRGQLPVLDVDTHAPAVAAVQFVVDEADHVAFFRGAIVQEKATEQAFAAMAPSAWPGLAFADGLWNGLGDFSRSYREIRDDLMKHLAVLSDDGAAIFALKLRQQIEARFMSRGIDISPENSETLANSHCRRRRERTFQGQLLVFDWHTKIEPHQDRIHVHPPTAASEGRTIVGIFHKHLPLPGD